MEVDTVGSKRTDWLIDDFIKYYDEHKEEIDSIATKRLNCHVRIYDKDGNRYRIRRFWKKMRLIRVTDQEPTTKHDMMTQINQLEAKINELQKTITDLTEALDDKQKSEGGTSSGNSEESDLDNGATDRFKQNLLRSIQDQAGEKRQKI